jgi:hypothetical protein
MNKLKNREIPFATLQDINKRIQGRHIVLFGAGNIAKKTARILDGKKIKAIVDNSTNLWGKKELNLKIESPKYLLTKEGRDSFVLICTTSFTDVAKQLEEYGLKAEKNYYVSPILNDLRIIHELEVVEKSMLFTSGAPKQDDDSFGGGIYELEVKGDQWKHRKVFSGHCYGLIQVNDNFISVDTELGIFEIDRDYNIIRSKELPPGTRGHGIDYSNKYGNYFVVGSHLDQVIMLDDNFKTLRQINISGKMERDGEARHHCNDCLVLGDSLYVSMFSVTGNWQKEVYDGGVLEFDIPSGELIGPVIQNLWMPHNIKFFEGSLQVLNSLQGQLMANNAQVIGEFPAFARGLAHDGIFYYVGQSKNRNYSKTIGLSNNISIDAGIIIFDDHTKVSRFLQLPPKISEVHSIALL